ncbi:MAG TPA: Fe-Mn family superoxide dismutase, partial [Myxococcota bacterium]
AAPAVAAAGQPAARPAPTFTPKLLGFDPKSIPGLSEKLIVSHHDNNYAGAVKNLAKVRQEIAATNKDTPAFVVAGLREKELAFYGSLVLHELYFGNLGGDGKPAGSIAKALPNDRQERLHETAAGLGGGSGWAMLCYGLHTGELVVVSSTSHTQNLAAGLPLLVLDMYEHAYAMDYGAAAAKYIDAFFQNVAWEEVDKRYQRALKARGVLTT